MNDWIIFYEWLNLWMRVPNDKLIEDFNIELYLSLNEYEIWMNCFILKFPRELALYFGLCTLGWTYHCYAWIWFGLAIYLNCFRIGSDNNECYMVGSSRLKNCWLLMKNYKYSSFGCISDGLGIIWCLSWVR